MYELDEARLGVPTGYRLTDTAVQYEQKDLETGANVWKTLCSRLVVKALGRNGDGGDWARGLELTDLDGKTHTLLIQASDVVGEGTRLLSLLLDSGLKFIPSRGINTKLITYIAGCNPKKRLRRVYAVGWHTIGKQRVYVLPHAVFGVPDSEEIYFDYAGDHKYLTAGTLEQWQEHVGQYCAGNSRLVFAASVPFASVLLPASGLESGGFHIVGNSQCGKTSSLRISSSVLGGDGSKDGFIRTWNNTKVAMELTATLFNHSTLFLDELGQAPRGVVGDVIYMLGNAQGKGRGQKNITVRGNSRFHLLFLSTGELTLAQRMAEDKQKMTAGLDVRCPDIPADAGKSMGIVEELHGFASPEKLIDALRKGSRSYYGTPIRAFLDGLLKWQFEEIEAYLENAMRDFSAAFIPKGADGQVQSIGKRFALVAAGGELASHLGITSWKQGEALKAAGACLRAYLEQRGGTETLELQHGLARVQKFFQQYSDSRFTEWEASSGNERKLYETMGFIKRDEGSLLYYVWSQSFDEIIAGLPKNMLLAEMQRLGWLQVQEKGRYQTTARPPKFSNTKRFYVLTEKVLGGEHE